jgi:hypothetical protein
MATLSLLYPDPLRPTGPPPGLHFAGGYDLAPLPVEVAVTPEGLTLSRPDQDSGFVITPWDVPATGVTVVNTATLRQRPEPYRLAVELARGKLNSVRNQTAEWADIGLDVSPLYREKLRAAGRLFGHAVVSDDPTRADALAAELLGEAHGLANELVETYTQQVFRTRHQTETRIRTAFGARLEGVPPAGDDDEAYRRAFNAARLVPVWKEIESTQGEFDWSGFDALVGWALTAGLNVGIGPIVDLRPGRLPEWIREHNGDWPTIAAYACEFAELVMVRYGERVGVWEVVAGFNHAGAIGLIEDDRLRLAARLLDAARQIDKEGELIIGLAQPWGEYRADPDANYSPLLFADTLLRAGIRAAAFSLDIAETGPSPSAARDALDVVRLLDSFGVLGLQLEVLLASPTTGPAEATARAARVAAVAAAMPHVKGVYWRDWDDPATGLVGPEGPRPLFGQLEAIRTAHLA